MVILFSASKPNRHIDVYQLHMAQLSKRGVLSTNFIVSECFSTSYIKLQSGLHRGLT